MTYVNLECCFKDDSANKVDKLWNFRAPTDFARVLTLGSVEQVNIANNHYIDYGASDRTSTRTAPDNDFRPVPLEPGDAYDAVMANIQADSPAPVSDVFLHRFPLRIHIDE